MKDRPNPAEERRERLLTLRTQRLGTDRLESEASAPKKAASHTAAQTVARRTNSTTDAVLALDLKRLAGLEYPREQCLSAADIDEYVHTSATSDIVLTHIHECPECEALIKSLRPPLQKEAEFRRAASGEFVAV